MTISAQNAFDDDNWKGGYYEAAMVLGATTAPWADHRLRVAIMQLWSSSSLKLMAIGDLARWQPSNSSVPETASVGELQRIYGTFTDPALGLVPFTSVVVREEDPKGEDWLYASVPLGGIARSGRYPFGDVKESRLWREPLEKSLAGLTLRVCEAAPMRLAAIGFEIAGVINAEADDIPTKDLRRIGYVTKHAGKYRYWPTTVWA